MPECKICNFTFPRLDSGATCQRCQARKPGLSSPELHALNLKPQCAACSLLFKSLPCAICQGCLNFYLNQPALPPAIYRLPGVAAIIARLDTSDVTIHTSQGIASDRDECNSDLALEIVSRAQTQRTQASTSRLTVGPPKSVQSTSTSNKFNNLTKAAQVTAERRQKKAEAQLREDNNGVTIVGSIWEYDGRARLVEVRPPIHVRRTFSNNQDIKECLDDLLDQARSDYEKSKPLADKLTWDNVQLLADCGGVNDWASLSHLDRSQSVKDLFDTFRKEKYASSMLLKASTIKIRFAASAGLEIHSEVLESLSYARSAVSAKMKSKKSLKRARADTTTDPRPLGSRKSLGLPKSSSHCSTSGSVQNTGEVVPAPVILKSAFRPPPRWSRNPPMEAYQFTRTIANVQNDGSVISYHSSDDEIIEIATDWALGEEAFLNKRGYGETGYIGRGATKRAIYARFGRKEYVLTQNFDDLTTPAEVWKNLMGEYELLAQCDWFKDKFDGHATNIGVTTLPKFYFNYADSILGELKPSLSSSSTHVPFVYFIATPLLPCGKVDGKIRKFTGNDQFGDASDDLTKTIHAFIHFSVVYSNNHILFCDLQGALDSQGVMCLIDPQAHTNVPSDSTGHYWDLGSQSFERIIDQHYSVCQNNWVCERLCLKNILIVDELQSSTAAKQVREEGQMTSHGKASPFDESFDHALD